MVGDKVPVIVEKRTDSVGAGWIDADGIHHTEEKTDKGPGVGSIGVDGNRYKDGKLVGTATRKES